MADIKISALPTATTPLTGAELVPVVQGGVTKQTTTSDVLAVPITSLTASSAVATDASKKLVSVANTGTGDNVLANGPTLVAPALGTPASGNLLNAIGLPIATGVSGLGTGVATALAISVGTAGSPVVNGGALGTPSSGTLTSATGLPISTGVSGLGTGVATALAVNVGTAGSPVVNGGALGTPSSGTLTSATGLPLTTGVTGLLPIANGGTATATPALVAGTNVTITGTWPNQTINSTGGGGGGGTVTSVSVVSANGLAGTVANPTTTPAITLSTSVTGVVKGNGTTLSAATAGTDYVAPGGALGTPSSGTVTNLTGTANITATGGASGAIAATTLSASSTVSGTGFSTYLASPPAIGGTTPAAVSATSLTDSGNLTFTGTGNRITGDFSNATIASRVFFQSSTANGTTSVSALPNGSGTAANFSAYSNSGVTDAQRAQISCVGGSDVRVVSDYIGAGSYLPMTLYTGGSERVRVDTSGNVGIGTSSPTSKLTVNGTLNFGNSAGVAMSISNDFGGNTLLTLAEGSSGLRVVNSANSAEHLRIDSNGNVGIGTSSPGSKLQINTAAASTAAIKITDNTNYSLIGGYAGTTCGYIGGDTGSSFALYANNSEKIRIDAGGNVTVSTAALLGYGTGSGGTVTQATSKATAVTLNKPTGQITMNNAALAAGASVIFGLNNTLLSTVDSLVVQPNFATNSQGYVVSTTYVGASLAYIRVTNITGGSLSEALTLTFAVLKGATS